MPIGDAKRLVDVLHDNLPSGGGAVVHLALLRGQMVNALPVLCRVRYYAERGFDDTVVSPMVSEESRIFSRLSLGIVFGVF